MNETKRLRKLEDENRRRKHLVADLSLDRVGRHVQPATMVGFKQIGFFDHTGMRYWGPDREASPDATVEQIAGRMVDLIRAVQECGPYRLAGHCFGGWVAFEIACQLSH